jgi:predicted DsbA family dithiol-disulfide isomerase
MRGEYREFVQFVAMILPPSSTTTTIISFHLERVLTLAFAAAQMTEALFRAYFENQKDISDLTTLAEIATSVGLPDAVGFLATDALKADVVAEARDVSTFSPSSSHAHIFLA